MPNRKSLAYTLWITTSLALLVAIVVMPIRTSRLVTVSFRSDCLLRNFALPPGQSKAHPSVAMTAGVVLQMKALPSRNETQDQADTLDEPTEKEEQDWIDALEERRVCFLLPGSVREVPNRQLIVPSSILSLRPLRC